MNTSLQIVSSTAIIISFLYQFFFFNKRLFLDHLCVKSFQTSFPPEETTSAFTYFFHYVE